MSSKKVIVTDIETGESFDSMEAASKAWNVSHMTLTRARKKAVSSLGTTVKGRRVQFKESNNGGRHRVGCPVQCVEMETVFPTLTAASIEAGVHVTGISNAIKTGSRAGGYHWRKM